MTSYKFLIGAVCCLFVMTGCSNLRDQLGLDKQPPDEFAVVTRAPLEFPDNMVLVKPQPGQQRPQEKATVQAAKEAVFGTMATAAGSENVRNRSGAETFLLKKAGADSVEENIRTVVNAETEKLAERNKPVVEKLIGLGSENTTASASVVDPKAEFERIKDAREKGKVITGDGSAMVEQ